MKDNTCKTYLHTYKCDKEDCKDCENRLTQSFVVLINGDFVRDAQILNPKKIWTNENEMCACFECDDNWKDCHHLDLFLGVYKWPSADLEGLLKHVSKAKGYPKEILSVYVA